MTTTLSARLQRTVESGDFEREAIREKDRRAAPRTCAGLAADSRKAAREVLEGVTATVQARVATSGRRVLWK
jgi:hypothetical protein